MAQKKHFTSAQADQLLRSATPGYLDPKESRITLDEDRNKKYHPDYVVLKEDKFKEVTGIDPFSTEAKSYAAWREIRQHTYEKKSIGKRVVMPRSHFYVYLDAAILEDDKNRQPLMEQTSAEKSQKLLNKEQASQLLKQATQSLKSETYLVIDNELALKILPGNLADYKGYFSTSSGQGLVVFDKTAVMQAAEVATGVATVGEVGGEGRLAAFPTKENVKGVG